MCLMWLGLLTSTMSQCRRAQPTSSTTLDPPKRLSYFVICPNLTLGPFVLDLEGAKIVEQLRYKIYQKHKLLREYYDYSELVVYKVSRLFCL
ncbi:uncharacterized protein EI90DRAFT_3048415, partial [Cantharellus anzutake]|uniref:uncharacterized protein n=1 Tax=Cantharellus anzutake TaxID=1750568 RepID=UPI001904924D